ncbi:hypothetical protein TX298_18915 [Klebsiella pneumoniae]|nr:MULTISPECIES: hypothetical protein [Klebsiella]HCT8082653.1 hypothetical protein [Klebsiella variicola]ANF12256.1 hypothetical protein A7321_25640 [Klebsiella pneumoniae]ANN54864.1 hypothetical protein BAU11_00205 [Klebsiella pneumoniae]EIX9596837.1 hypothetical protein [Klebsiella pneumoniae]EIX9623721.1 hypothetical protein [Klebsiella pneumoniae]
MQLPQLIKGIEKELRGSMRPESTLFERYVTSDEEQKREFVVALIGKLIELDRFSATLKKKSDSNQD